MPELPEVETVRRQLARVLAGRRVVSVAVRYPKAVRPLSADAFAASVRGARFVSVGRRAKVLALGLSNGKSVLVHLKMTGRLLIEKKGVAPRKETEVVFSLDRGQLFYDDIRRFGWLKAMPTAAVAGYFDEQAYGPEPLGRSFTAAKLALCMRSRPGKRVKQLLMDQTCVAGVGNIYADETLWASGIRPTRRVADMKDADFRALFRAMRTILPAAIRARGSSANDYLDVFGRQGTYVPRLKAYGRDGEPCAKKDGGVIRKIALGGRGTHYCPVHQR